MNYLLYGEEEYLIKKRIKEILVGNLVDEVEYASTFYDALSCSLQAILDDANTLSMFSENKVIIVENAHYFMSSKKGREKTDSDELENQVLLSYLDSTNTHCVIIFVCYGNVDTKKRIVKEALLKCKSEAFNRLDVKELRTYVIKYLKSHNTNVDADVLDEIIRRLPPYLYQSIAELEKLTLYPEVLTIEVVESLLIRPLEDNVFNLCNALLNRDINSAFLIWHDFMKLNIEPLLIIATFATQLRFCFQVVYLRSKGLSDDEIAMELKCKSGRIYITNKIIKGRTPDDFLSILSKLCVVDLQIKSGILDKKSAFEYFLINMR